MADGNVARRPNNGLRVIKQAEKPIKVATWRRETASHQNAKTIREIERFGLAERVGVLQIRDIVASRLRCVSSTRPV
jgi:hypothetical protein